ncbi:MAG: hypothetical protein JWN86_508 [Planctomycetota bacterium]|nr:hypothetical protein [Planctomycetota bacterium]
MPMRELAPADYAEIPATCHPKFHPRSERACDPSSRVEGMRATG